MRCSAALQATATSSVRHRSEHGTGVRLVHANGLTETIYMQFDTVLCSVDILASALGAADFREDCLS